MAAAVYLEHYLDSKILPLNFLLYYSYCAKV